MKKRSFPQGRDLFFGGAILAGGECRRKFEAERRISAGRIHFARGSEIKEGSRQRFNAVGILPPAAQEKAIAEAKALADTKLQ